MPEATIILLYYIEMFSACIIVIYMGGTKPSLHTDVRAVLRPSAFLNWLYGNDMYTNVPQLLNSTLLGLCNFAHFNE